MFTKSNFCMLFVNIRDRRPLSSWMSIPTRQVHPRLIFLPPHVSPRPVLPSSLTWSLHSSATAFPVHGVTGGQQLDKPIKGPHVSPWRSRMAPVTHSHSPPVCQPLWLTSPVSPTLTPTPSTSTRPSGARTEWKSFGLACHSLIRPTKASAPRSGPLLVQQWGPWGGQSVGTVPSDSTSSTHEQGLFLSFPVALHTLKRKNAPC